MPNIIDLSGQRFGRLIALKKSENRGKNGAVWDCICDCGNEKSVDGDKLRSKNTRSCGCLLKEKSAERKLTHGKIKSTEYNSWRGMVDRCTNPNTSKFSYYGGRGITICDRWVHSFENFLEDMGEKPTTNHSLDRKDVNGNYEPDNCKWATKREQSINQRMMRTNTSGHTGIFWNNKSNKWVAFITINNKRTHIGSYDKKEDAIKERKRVEETRYSN